ncbi:hypothetical protein [Halorussus sp. MSC15.2]|uniref:hypothetical protein n=1 Tax=Halorussus sp. MSC15.2 TaxID=2283638 RepID=UPI0013D261CA|nr:hypothetical protein [Halorussus sp. MSC15.2]NEU56359.1 hypothetical protein [Halorussus sp. MSC15.2]
MSPSPPFLDRKTGTIDWKQVFREAVPLARLVGVFVAVALVPFAFVFLFEDNAALRAMFTVATQFVLAVGSGIVLMYVVSRGIRLADEQ